jgi:hypothetical protein
MTFFFFLLNFFFQILELSFDSILYMYLGLRINWAVLGMTRAQLHASRELSVGPKFQELSKNCPHLLQGPYLAYRSCRILIGSILFENKREGTLHRTFLLRCNGNI